VTTKLPFYSDKTLKKGQKQGSRTWARGGTCHLSIKETSGGRSAHIIYNSCSIKNEPSERSEKSNDWSKRKTKQKIIPHGLAPRAGRGGMYKEFGGEDTLTNQKIPGLDDREKGDKEKDKL